MHVRMAAAITFKNFVKHNWHMVSNVRRDDSGIFRVWDYIKRIYSFDLFSNYKVEGEPNKISDADRTTVKTYIVDLMLSMPSNLQRQLSEAVRIYTDITGLSFLIIFLMIPTCLLFLALQLM